MKTPRASDAFMASPIGKAVLAYGRVVRGVPGAAEQAVARLLEIERAVEDRVAAERKDAANE